PYITASAPCPSRNSPTNSGEEATKKANKRKGVNEQSVTVLASRLLSPTGAVLPLEEVFEEARRARITSKRTFQPAGLTWRLCFQLEEPPPMTTNDDLEPQTWLLRILLQATD